MAVKLSENIKEKRDILFSTQVNEENYISPSSKISVGYYKSVSDLTLIKELSNSELVRMSFGKKVKTFVYQVIHRMKKPKESTNKLILSVDDSIAFIEELNREPKTSSKLREAFELHKNNQIKF